MLEIILIITTLLELNPITQIYKMLKTNKKDGVSVLTFIMILTIGCLWLVYGIQIHSIPLIIGNTIKIITCAGVLVTYKITK